MKLKRFFVNMFTYSLFFCGMMSKVFAGGQPVLSTVVTGSLTEIAEILFLVGAAVCVGKCIHIGILYVTSSAVEKSNAKMAVLPWVIGTFICFGGATIGKFIIGILEIDQPVLSY